MAASEDKPRMEMNWTFQSWRAPNSRAYTDVNVIFNFKHRELTISMYPAAGIELTAIAAHITYHATCNLQQVQVTSTLDGMAA